MGKHFDKKHEIGKITRFINDGIRKVLYHERGAFHMKIAVCEIRIGNLRSTHFYFTFNGKMWHLHHL